MNLTNHLTDEQMYDLLEAEPDTANAHPHLRGCAACQSELARVRASLVDFRSATTGFAAANTPLYPPVALRVPARLPMPRLRALSFAAATVVIAASIALLHPMRSNSRPAETEAVAAPQAPVTESDAALLDDIQQDLSTSIPPSLKPLEVASAPGDTSAQN